MTIAVVVFLILVAIVILFQLALALGAPWGEYAMGGRFPGRFPPQMRVAAVIQIAVLLLLAVIVLARSELAFDSLYALSRVAIWFVVGFFVLGSAMNLATPSKKERMIWGPVNVAMLILSIIVALS